jgi:hypothetical protein
MPRIKTYYYLIDNLTSENGEIMKRALQATSSIKSITLHIREGLLEVMADRDVEDVLRIACELAGTRFRIKVKKRKALR